MQVKTKEAQRKTSMQNYFEGCSRRFVRATSRKLFSEMQEQFLTRESRSESNADLSGKSFLDFGVKQEIGGRKMNA